MSEMERVKVTLRKVLDGNFEPVNIQNWREAQWSVYLDKEVDQEIAYDIAKDFFSEKDWDFDYFHRF